MKTITVIVLLLLIAIPLYCKETPRYPVKDIPEQLRKNVNVVFREDVMSYKITSVSSAVSFTRQVITIFNGSGKDYAEEHIGYDKLSRVNYIKANVYDGEGNLVRRLKQNEIKDESAYDGVSMFSDNRVKIVDLTYGSYPYTVEIEYQIELKYLFSIPTWTLISDEKVSVELSAVTIQYPPQLRPRYKLINVALEPTVTASGAVETMHWEFRNLEPIEIESFSPVHLTYQQIRFGLSDFEYDSYSGNMTTWESFGKWVQLLNQNRNTLPEGVKQKVKSLTTHTNDQEEKIKILYQYLQSKTRYVSIQLGIGGYQPFTASMVEQFGYGDCKALSNYMVSLLHEVGIRAHYCLVRAGENAAPIDISFPSPQFNHAIVCVPNGRDTIWLECTSQTNPFGYMGSFTGDRKALAITENGGKIVSTPRYSPNVNVQSRNATVQLDKEGNGRAQIKTTYSGIEFENGDLHFVLNNQYDKQEKWIRNNTRIAAFDVESFKMTTNNERIPKAVVDIKLSLPRLASVSGKRIFITPNLMNRSAFIPEKNTGRKNPIALRSTYTHVDTIVYDIPADIYPEFVPESIKIESSFGHYQSYFQMDEGKILYIRKLTRFRGEFPPDKYAEFVEFYKGINKADNVKLVFLTKT